MRLTKDDPVYYKLKVNTLIQEAFQNGLKIEAKIYDDRIGLLFKADNGDVAESVFQYS